MSVLRRSLALLIGLGLAVPVMAGQTPATAPTIPGDAYLPSSAPVLPHASQDAIPGDAYWKSPTGGTAFPGASAVVPPSSIDGVMADQLIKDQHAAKETVPYARAAAIQDAATTYGVQAGMAARAYQINQVLTNRASAYDRVFNFNAVMLEPGFLPPVISEGRNAYNQPSAMVVRAADRIYKIEFPARLISSAPTWRDYLPVAYAMPALPDASVLPKNAAEKNLWDAWARQGWQQGSQLADATFEANSGRLKRDFEGMLRYKSLYQQGVVQKPMLAKSNLGVTGGGDEMAINDRVYEVTRKAALDPDSKRWSKGMPKTDQTDSGQPDPINAQP